jgi:hypothetical protein
LPTFQAAIVTSSSTLRLLDDDLGSAWWSKTSAVSRMRTDVTTGSACAPMAAMVATSPAIPPAPLARSR